MIVMTMMVRDEADIVGAMIEHHLAQGIDLFLVTDNGSVDGTTEILEEFARDGRIELSHDPRHLKQQHEVVTAMSREAARRGAQWVLNADADEFWVCAHDTGRTVADELAEIDPAIGAFEVPVIDMTGPPALSGSGLQRLLFRDQRPDAVMRDRGIHAHSTPDVAFVPHGEVTVAQGNHFVDVASEGELGPGRGLQVYHFPWRSWAQFERKVGNAGRAYEASPHLRPSVNHHGMRDYRRLNDGLLLASYIARHPTEEELADGIEKGWFVEDRRIADRVRSPQPDELVPRETIALEREVALRMLPVDRRVLRLEGERREALDRLAFETTHVAELDQLVAALRRELDESRRTGRARAEALGELHEIRLVRWALRLNAQILRVKDRFGRLKRTSPPR